MDKPERRKLEKGSPYLQYDKGYNHAWYDWERYIKENYTLKSELMSEGEINKIMTAVFQVPRCTSKTMKLSGETVKADIKKLAKKLSARVRKPVDKERIKKIVCVGMACFTREEQCSEFISKCAKLNIITDKIMDAIR